MTAPQRTVAKGGTRVRTLKGRGEEEMQACRHQAHHTGKTCVRGPHTQTDNAEPHVGQTAQKRRAGEQMKGKGG